MPFDAFVREFRCLDTRGAAAAAAAGKGARGAMAVDEEALAVELLLLPEVAEQAGITVASFRVGRTQLLLCADALYSLHSLKVA